MIATLDTPILVAGFCSKGASHAIIFEEFLEGRFEWAISVALFLEYEDVLTRPHILSMMNGKSNLEVCQTLDAILELSKKIYPIHYSYRPILPDPDDERVLECVVTSSSQYLVTLNHKHFKDSATKFGFDILSPAQFLHKIKRRS